MKQLLKKVSATTLLCMTLAGAPAYADNLPDFTQLVDQYGPTVVNISTTRTVKRQTDNMPDMSNETPEQMQEMLRRFFGENRGPNNGPREFSTHSLGSGFIISDDGYVVTNNHVIDGADAILVRLSDGRELDAKLIGADDGSDLALLKVDATGLPVAKFGSSKDLKVGEWVLAIGSPFGFDHSAAAGIVSAKGRGLETEKYVPFIQTDVAINPGNSGGPLFDLKGEVVGINSQIISRTGGSMGLSFAIPSDIAVEVIEELKKEGHVTRGWLGISFQNVDRNLAKSFGLDTAEGALVAEVVPDSPADKAGLKAGDVITKMNDENIESASDLPHFLGRVKPDTKVTLSLVRDKKLMTLPVVVEALPQEVVETDKSGQVKPAAYGRLGVQIRGLTDQERSRIGQKQPGVVVEAVDPDSSAFEAGIRRGDLILTINQQQVSNEEQYKKAVAALKDGSTIPVLIARRGEVLRYLALQVGAAKTKTE